MIDTNTARIVKAAIQKKLKLDFSLDDICKMRMIPKIDDHSYSILALQAGDLTILAWVSVDEEECSVRVTNVSRVSW